MVLELTLPVETVLEVPPLTWARWFAASSLDSWLVQELCSLMELEDRRYTAPWSLPCQSSSLEVLRTWAARTRLRSRQGLW